MNLPYMRHTIHAPPMFSMGRQYEAVDDHLQTSRLFCPLGKNDLFLSDRSDTACELWILRFS